jgi:hypothetical protein
MFQHGNFTFRTQQLVPEQAAAIIHTATAPQPV